MPVAIIHVRRAAAVPWRGVLALPGSRLACSLGRTGISRNKREGDGATPAGVLRPYGVLYRADRVPPPPTLLPAEALRPNDGWCDDPDDARYNQPVRLPYRGGHEGLWRGDNLYDVVVLLDWNCRPVRRGRGSAIFLHCARGDRGPTEGCIAVDPAAMPRLLAVLSPETEFRVG